MVTQLLFYYCNYNTLGHCATVFSLVKRLKQVFKTKIKIVVIEVGIKEAKVFPFNKYSKVHFYPLIKNNPLAFGSSLATIPRKKFNFLKNVADDFKPDIFITDFYPFSNHINYQWLEHFLKYLKNKFGSKIVSSCPCVIWTDQMDGIIKNYYDLILFHFPKEFLLKAKKYLPKQGLDTLNKTLNGHSKKIKFTGFIFDKQGKIISKKSIRDELGLRDEKLIVVSRGGRQECEKLIPSVLWLAKKHKDWFFLISSGSLIDKSKFNKYTQISKQLENVKLTQIIYPNFCDYLRAADLSINMAGYNTIVELLYLHKKAVVIPIDKTDQPINLAFASNFIPVQRTDENDLEPKVLEKKIMKLLDAKTMSKHYSKNNWFSGVDLSVNLIGELL